jgi:hypothetical protein
MDSRSEVICEAAPDAIRRGEPAATPTRIETGGSTSREIAVGILSEVIAVRRRGG